jgi:hypothetical protein
LAAVSAISGFWLPFVLGASDPRSADSPTDSHGGSPRSDEMPPFQRVQRACESLELLHSMTVEEAGPAFGSLLRRFRFLVCCQGETCGHWRTRDCSRGWHQRAWSAVIAVCHWLLPEGHDSPETPIGTGSRGTWTGYADARSQDLPFRETQ